MYLFLYLIGVVGFVAAVQSWVTYITEIQLKVLFKNTFKYFSNLLEYKSKYFQYNVILQALAMLYFANS